MWILKKVANWKTPGHDGIYEYRFKKSTSINNCLTFEMHRCLPEIDIHQWISKEKTVLIKNDPLKRIPA